MDERLSVSLALIVTGVCSEANGVSLLCCVRCRNWSKGREHFRVNIPVGVTLGLVCYSSVSVPYEFI